jgi:hypothetical protein
VCWKSGLDSLPLLQDAINTDSITAKSTFALLSSQAFVSVSLLLERDDHVEAFLGVLPNLCTTRLRSLRITFHVGYVSPGLTFTKIEEYSDEVAKVLTGLSFPVLERFEWTGFVPVKSMISIFPQMERLKHALLSTEGNGNYSDEEDEPIRLDIVNGLSERCTMLESVYLNITPMFSKKGAP